jgi:myosin-5
MLSQRSGVRFLTGSTFRFLHCIRTGAGLIQRVGGSGQQSSPFLSLSLSLSAFSDIIDRADLITAGTSKEQTISKRVVAANPVLEAFGNARTVLNGNSSRFGKFTAVHCGGGHRTVTGAHIQTYLLERTRVTARGEGDASFHIFYQLMAGVPAAELRAWGVPATPNYLCCRGSAGAGMHVGKVVVANGWGGYVGIGAGGDSGVDLDGSCAPPATHHFETDVEAAGGYKKTMAAFASLGLCAADRQHVLELVGAVLVLGEIEIAGATAFSSLSTDDNMRVQNEGAPVSAACKLLGVDCNRFATLLVSRTIIVAGETTVLPLKPTEFMVVRDTVAKTIYVHLFDWIVGFINRQTILSTHTATTDADTAAAAAAGDDATPRTSASTFSSAATSTSSPPVPPRPFIGLLDIFGFENLPTNSLEQLCINFANEQLQHHYVSHALESEQAVYEAEGLAWERIAFVNNKACLELLSGKCKLFDLLDEDCRLNRGAGNGGATSSAPTKISTPQGPCNSYKVDLMAAVFADCKCGFAKSEHGVTGNNFISTGGKQQVGFLANVMATLRGNKHLLPALKHRQGFGVKHYAGAVAYDASTFVEKNNERSLDEHAALLAQSSKPLLAEFFAAHLPAAVGSPDAALLNTKGPVRRKRHQTVVVRFQRSLKELFSVLEAAQCHYIRCLNPNGSTGVASTGTFEHVKVAKQLEACGVLESIRISAAGHPSKPTYVAFLARYAHALPVRSKVHPYTERASAQAIVAEHCTQERLNLPRFGSSRIFLKEVHVSQLEAVRSLHYHAAAVALQSVWKAVLQRRAYTKVRASIIVVQQQWKRIIQQKRAAVAVIAASWLAYSRRKQFDALTASLCVHGTALHIGAAPLTFATMQMYHGSPIKPSISRAALLHTDRAPYRLRVECASAPLPTTTTSRRKQVGRTNNRREPTTVTTTTAAAAAAAAIRTNEKGFRTVRKSITYQCRWKTGAAILPEELWRPISVGHMFAQPMEWVSSSCISSVYPLQDVRSFPKRVTALGNAHVHDCQPKGLSLLCALTGME